MRKAVDLIKLLLLELEGEEPVDLTDLTSDQINYHKALIVQAGFAEGIINYSTSSDARPEIPDLAILTRPTYAGHDSWIALRMKRCGAKQRKWFSEMGWLLLLKR